jgi:hypothetical protein
MNGLRKSLILTRNELFLRGAFRIVSVFELLMAALLIGLIGEGYFQNLAWINTLLNGAVMLCKIFVAFYVLYTATILTIFAHILFVEAKGRRLFKF